RRVLHDFLADHPAAVAADHRSVRDLAVHAGLERFPVRGGVFFRRAPADHGRAQQSGEHFHRSEGIQRRHGGGDHRRPADAAGVCDSRKIFSTRADRRRGERIEEAMGALSIKHVTKRFAAVEVLKGIDVEVDDGEFLILVGPSGCGKSTLLNVIAGLDTATSGELWIGGRMVNELSPKDRDIAMVFQSYALYPTMIVRENISFGLQIRKTPPAELKKIVDKVSELL